jgi:hypothetical protein
VKRKKKGKKLLYPKNKKRKREEREPGDAIPSSIPPPGRFLLHSQS